MYRFALPATAIVALVLVAACVTAWQDTDPDDQAPTTQPADTTGETGDDGRKPFQRDILRSLLTEKETPRRIAPTDPKTQELTTPDPDDPTSVLLLEGTWLVERPGRLIRQDDTSQFEFRLSNSERTIAIEILPNSLRETMERAADAGHTEFVVSAEVTRYRNHNYLLLRGVSYRVSNNNLSP